jgi:hypothetical protein
VADERVEMLVCGGLTETCGVGPTLAGARPRLCRVSRRVEGSVGAKSIEEICGYEYDWLGCDADAHVALFSTAGDGYAPDEFLRDTDAYDRAIDVILASPATTHARFAPTLRADLVNTWRLVAERGLFAYDAHALGGPYRLVAAPEVPVGAAALPAIVADVLRRLTFGHLRFSELSIISENNLLDQSR